MLYKEIFAQMKPQLQNETDNIKFVTQRLVESTNPLAVKVAISVLSDLIDADMMSFENNFVKCPTFLQCFIFDRTLLKLYADDTFELFRGGIMQMKANYLVNEYSIYFRTPPEGDKLFKDRAGASELVSKPDAEIYEGLLDSISNYLELLQNTVQGKEYLPLEFRL